MSIEINVPKAPKEAVPSSAPLICLSGRFGIGKWQVPYLTTNMSFSAAARDLKTASDIPNDDEIPWKVEELFQRDIDWGNVDKITSYLSDEENPQFFNSITVALLPFDANSQRLVEGFDAPVEWAPPEFDVTYPFEMTVGPVSLGFWEEPDPSGQIPAIAVARWNLEQVYGVAIDGQHRLAAIRAATQKHVGADRYKNSRVSVILLLLDERVGFKAPEERPVVELLRSLFIDLNKHAKIVSRPRQILLDDRDPHALCVRTLMAGTLSDSIASLEPIDAFQPPRLPLSLVDWHSENYNKVDKGPYLTTVLGLDGLVNLILGSRPLSDYTDYGAIRRQLKLLQRNVGVDLSLALERVDQYDADSQRPFSYTQSELESISKSFEETWNAALIALLTEFGPYARLIEQREELQSYSLSWQHWYRLRSRIDSPGGSNVHDKSEYEGYLDELIKGQHPIGEKTLLGSLRSIEATKNEVPLAFAVVFQRAVFIAFTRLMGVADVAAAELANALWNFALNPDFEDSADDELIGELENDVEEGEDEVSMGDALERARSFIEVLNRALDPEYLEVSARTESERAYIWGGSLRKPDGTIDFTQAAANRAADLLLLLAFLGYAQNGEHSFDGVWGTLLEGKGSLAPAKAAITRQSKPEGLGGRVLTAQDLDPDEGAAMAEVRRRVEALWERLRES